MRVFQDDAMPQLLWGIAHISGPNKLPRGLVIARRHLRNVFLEKNSNGGLVIAGQLFGFLRHQQTQSRERPTANGSKIAS
jgi:hypothetical protein